MTILSRFVFAVGLLLAGCAGTQQTMDGPASTPSTTSPATPSPAASTTPPAGASTHGSRSAS